MRLPLREISSPANGVGCGAEAVELGLEEPVRMVERLCARDRID